VRNEDKKAKKREYKLQFKKQTVLNIRVIDIVQLKVDENAKAQSGYDNTKARVTIVLKDALPM
jgi:sRNA-binding protein